MVTHYYLQSWRFLAVVAALGCMTTTTTTTMTIGNNSIRIPTIITMADAFSIVTLTTTTTFKRSQQHQYCNNNIMSQSSKKASISSAFTSFPLYSKQQLTDDNDNDSIDDDDDDGWGTNDSSTSISTNAASTTSSSSTNTLDKDKTAELQRLQQERLEKMSSSSNNNADFQRSVGNNSATTEPERDLFIPIFAIVSLLGLFGSYGYEMFRLYSRGELYLPF